MTFYAANTKIVISFYFAAVITLLLVFSKTDTALICLAGCILHETGHLIMMAFFKSYPKEISFNPFGMKITAMNMTNLSAKKEMLIYLSGPCANLIAALVCFALNENKIAQINLFLGIFNLLPVKSTDGGAALTLIAGLFLSDDKAKIIINIIGGIVLLFVFLIGAYQIINTRFNCSLIIVGIYLLIMYFKKS